MENERGGGEPRTGAENGIRWRESVAFLLNPCLKWLYLLQRLNKVTYMPMLFELCLRTVSNVVRYASHKSRTTWILWFAIGNVLNVSGRHCGFPMPRKLSQPTVCLGTGTGRETHWSSAAWWIDMSDERIILCGTHSFQTWKHTPCVYL